MKIQKFLGLASAPLILVLLISQFGNSDNNSSLFSAQTDVVNSNNGRTNVRILIKDSLITIGFKDKYSALFLGTPLKPYDGVPSFFIALPDKTILDLSLPSSLSLIRNRAIAAPENSRIKWDYYDYLTKQKYYWPDGTERIQVGFYVFYVQENKIIGFSILAHTETDEFNIILVGTDINAMTELPIDSEDYIRAFGEPNQVYETYDWK